MKYLTKSSFSVIDSFGDGLSREVEFTNNLGSLDASKGVISARKASQKRKTSFISISNFFYKFLPG